MAVFLRKWLKKLNDFTRMSWRPAQRQSPTVCIGASTITLGVLVRGAKKRLGDNGLRPSLTQSLTLSLIARRLAKLKSSDKVRLILEDRFFHFVDVEAPEQIPAHELDSIFSWALKEKGFAPIDDWLWDILSTPTQAQPHYQLVLLERQQADLYLERLQLSRSQVTSIQPARAIIGLPSLPELPPGPWLNLEHLAVVLSSYTQRTMSVNLFANVVTRTQRHFQLGLTEFAIASLMVAGLVYIWWPRSPNPYLLPPQITLPSTAQTHPLLVHAMLWDALRQPMQVTPMHLTPVQLNQVEFRRGRWYVSLRANDLGSGQLWVEALTTALSAPWQVKPVSISSSEHASLFELEISR